MNNMNVFYLILAIISGAVLSLLYFGGLWVTVRHLAKNEWPSWTLLLSFLIRGILVIAVFYGLLLLHWAYLAVALVAFLMVRQIMINRLGKPDEVLYG